MKQGMNVGSRTLALAGSFMLGLALVVVAVLPLGAQTAISADGVVESTSGGFKFPDGTVQTTATSVGEPVQVEGACTIPDDANHVRGPIYAVPVGKRLELEFLTLGAFNLSDSEGLLPSIIADGGKSFFFEQLVGGTRFPSTGTNNARVMSKGVLIHAGPGSLLECEVWTTASVGNDRVLIVSIAGHLVDVVP